MKIIKFLPAAFIGLFACAGVSVGFEAFAEGDISKGAISIVLAAIIFLLAIGYLKILPKLQKVIEPIISKNTVIKKDDNVVSFTFADTAGDNQKMLKLLTDVKLSGVTKPKNGVNPQTIIPLLKKNQKLILEHINSPYDANAVSVSTDDGKFIGWVPADFSYKDDIAQRLDDSTPVFAVVSKIIGGDSKKSYGCLINIARYEKKRVKKATATNLE